MSPPDPPPPKAVLVTETLFEDDIGSSPAAVDALNVSNNWFQYVAEKVVLDVTGKLGLDPAALTLHRSVEVEPLEAEPRRAVDPRSHHSVVVCPSQTFAPNAVTPNCVLSVRT